jgi:hypothetical protein
LEILTRPFFRSSRPFPPEIGGFFVVQTLEPKTFTLFSNALRQTRRLHHRCFVKIKEFFQISAKPPEPNT